MIRFSRLPALCALALLAACSSTPPSRLFLLDARAPVLERDGATGRVIHLNAVRVPGHLRRPVVLRQKNANELSFSEFERWGEDLPENLQRVLEQNLRNVLPGDTVLSGERPAAGAILVSVEILRLTALDGKGLLEASARIDDGQGAVLRLSPRHQRPLSGDGPEAIVAVFSELIADLATDLAASLNAGAPAGMEPRSQE